MVATTKVIADMPEDTEEEEEEETVRAEEVARPAKAPAGGGKKPAVGAEAGATDVQGSCC